MSEKPCREEERHPELTAAGESVPTEPAPTPIEVTVTEKRYKPLTKLFPPSPATIAPNARLFIVEHEVGEGFLDFLYLNCSSNDLQIVIELDGDEWQRFTPTDIRNAATGLGIDGWMGWLGSQIFSDEDTAYGITLVPRKDCLPYYQTLRVWAENITTADITLRRAFLAWRRRLSE